MIMNLNAFYLLLFFVSSIGVKSSPVKSDIKSSQEDLFEDSEILKILREHGDDVVHHDSHNEIKPKKENFEGIEPPFEKVTVSELCGSDCGEVDSTSSYPQSEMTTENEETTQTVPTTVTVESSTENLIVYTPDLAILDETTSNSPPSEMTTE